MGWQPHHPPRAAPGDVPGRGAGVWQPRREARAAGGTDPERQTDRVSLFLRGPSTQPRIRHQLRSGSTLRPRRRPAEPPVCAEAIWPQPGRCGDRRPGQHAREGARANSEALAAVAAGDLTSGRLFTEGGVSGADGTPQVTHGSFMDRSFPGVNVAQCHASTHGLTLEAGSLLNRDPQTTPGSKARTQHSCGPGTLGF